MQYIRTGGQTEDGMWIISEGVTSDDTIIISGLQKVIPGRPVKIVQSSNAEIKEEVKKEPFLGKLLKKLKVNTR